MGASFIENMIELWYIVLNITNREEEHGKLTA